MQTVVGESLLCFQTSIVLVVIVMAKMPLPNLIIIARSSRPLKISNIEHPAIDDGVREQEHIIVTPPSILPAIKEIIAKSLKPASTHIPYIVRNRIAKFLPKKHPSILYLISQFHIRACFHYILHLGVRHADLLDQDL